MVNATALGLLGIQVSDIVSDLGIYSPRGCDRLPNCRFLGQYRPHPCKCANFYHCDYNGGTDPDFTGDFYPVLKRCPAGTYWDFGLTTCNHIWAVACEDKEDTTETPTTGAPTTFEATTEEPTVVVR